MQINENTKANGYEPNNGIWLKIHINLVKKNILNYFKN
jgi:hypothetical protein